MNNVLVDTCFWYALYDVRDENYAKANELVNYLELGKIIIPYPTLYETINTRFSKQKNWIESFENILKSESVTLIDDAEYKKDALNLTFNSSLLKNRPLSLVDVIIRLMLEDVNLKIDYLISFNTGDFIDVCFKKGIILLNE